MRPESPELSSRLKERLDHRWAGAWVALLPICGDDDVLLVDAAPSRARSRIAEASGRLGLISSMSPEPRSRVGVPDGQEPAIEGLGAGHHTNVIRAPLEEHLMHQWDWVIVDGAVPAPALLHELGSRVAPEGRLVVVVDNARSPLRPSHTFASADAFGPGRAGDNPGASALRRRLARAGLEVDRWFGLFRSSTVATTAFDVAAPSATRAVLDAALVHMTGRRAAGVRALRRLPARMRVTLSPGWLVIAAGCGSAATGKTSGGPEHAPESLRIVGRMGYERTPDAKILLGEPPAALERTYASPDGADAEAMALQALEAAGLDIAPRLLGRPRPGCCRIEWVTGRDLPVRTMSERDLITWTEKAAVALARIQAATRRSDGSVLVHGDFWLGNTLAAGGEVRWVIDWGKARWGDPAVDRAFLAEGLAGFRDMPEGLVDRLRAAVASGLAREPT